MHFFVVLEGTLQLAKQINGREIHLADLKVGDFFGELPLLLGLPSASSLKAKTACRVARFEAEQLQELIQTASACSKKILRVVKERLSTFQDYAMDLPRPRVLVVGPQHDANCQTVRNFLTLNRISHEWITRETERIRVPASLPLESNPIAMLIDGAQWVTPPVTVRTVARALGYRTQASSDSYDVVIVGGGPAGLAAAIYGASEGLKVLLIPEWLRLVPVDFEAGGSWWERLKTVGFDAGQPAVVASTGVSMYLTKDAIAATLR
jgi:thioredoxin reductase (NADPH)